MTLGILCSDVIMTSQLAHVHVRGLLCNEEWSEYHANSNILTVTTITLISDMMRGGFSNMEQVL